MKLKMNKIAVAVSAAMGASMVAGIANADNIFFPYVVKSPSVATILSVINTATPYDGTYDWRNDADRHTHVRLVYKADAAATNNTTLCSSIDRTYPSSRNDLVTFDIGGHFGDANAVLFGDPTAYGMDFGLARPAELMRGFVLVDNNSVLPSGGNYSNGAEATMFGEALVLEFANGAAWGYRALNADLQSDTLDFRPSDFASGPNGYRVPVLGYNGGAGGATLTSVGGMARATILPWGTDDQFVTTFFVTPTTAYGTNPGEAGLNVQGQYTTNLNAVIAPNLIGFANDSSAMMFDRDENPVSGRVPNDIVCVGAVNVTSMMTGFIQNGPERLTGGWTNVAISNGTLSTATYRRVSHAAVIKLEYNLTGTFDGTDSGGVFNNAFLMSVDHQVDN